MSDGALFDYLDAGDEHGWQHLHARPETDAA
jgi:hypothetical protein